VLFRHYPDIKTAYDRYLELVQIYNTLDASRPLLLTRLARWYERVRKMQMKSFNTVLETFMNNYDTILNYFDNRSTNASAESFNAKVKGFRLQFRGVRDIPFFIFRLATIFA
jgi:transposase